MVKDAQKWLQRKSEFELNVKQICNFEVCKIKFQMKKILLIVACFISVYSFGQNKDKKNYKEKISGFWQGVLSTSGKSYHVTFNIQKDEKDSLSGKLNVKEQGVVDLPMDKTWLKDSLLTMVCKVANIRYEGVFNFDSMKIKGVWKQHSAKIDLVLAHSDTVKVVNHPQEPKRPFPYTEEEVTVESTNGVKLAGTLTYPSTGDNFTAVVMVTGSGPQNRDEEIMGHKPFLVISDYLTRNGVAVLRCDDRGTNASTGDYAKASSVDNADDALACIEFLKKHAKINPKKIGIIGHSEGGLIAPMIAAKTKDVAFIIMLAGPGLSGDKILDLQRELISRAEKENEDSLKMDIALADKMFAIVKKEKDDKKAGEQMRKIYKESLPDSLKNDIKTSLQFSQQIATLTSSWMRFFLSYDPQKSLKKVKCPVLALNGEKDLQVPPKENIPAIEAALKKAGNKDYTVKEMPGLNHLFQHCTTGSPSEYANIEETFSPEVLDMIAKWILKR